MAFLKYIFFLLPSILFFGCYQVIEPDINFKPVLCINSLISEGKPIVVNVTHTWFYTDLEGEQNHTVNDATVRIFANGIEVDEDYLPKEGDTIRITAHSPTYGDAEGETTVPFKVPSCSFTYDLVKTHFEILDESYPMNFRIIFNLNVKIKFSDIKETTDFYHISFEGFPDNDGNYPLLDSTDYTHVFFDYGRLKYEAEPLFYEHIGEVESVFDIDPDGFLFFTDRTFSGNEYTLNLQFIESRFLVNSSKWDLSLLDCGLKIKLHSISESFYNWENYLWQIDSGIIGDMIDMGFSEPIWAYSNISTGAGVIAAESYTPLTVNLQSDLEKILLSEIN